MYKVSFAFCSFSFLDFFKIINPFYILIFWFSLLITRGLKHQSTSIRLIKLVFLKNMYIKYKCISLLRLVFKRNMYIKYKFFISLILFVGLIGVLRPSRKFFTYMETSQLLVKGCVRHMLGNYGH